MNSSKIIIDIWCNYGMGFFLNGPHVYLGPGWLQSPVHVNGSGYDHQYFLVGVKKNIIILKMVQWTGISTIKFRNGCNHAEWKINRWACPCYFTENVILIRKHIDKFQQITTIGIVIEFLTQINGRIFYRGWDIFLSINLKEG